MDVTAVLLVGALWASIVPTAEQIEAKFLHDTNAYRMAHGVPSLTPHEGLAGAARLRSDDMRLNYLSTPEYLRHRGSDGRPFDEHIATVEPRAVGVNENICRAGGGADWVALNSCIAALQQSERHRVNWLHKAYAYAGVGASVGSSGPHGAMLYVTQVFAVGFEDQSREVMVPGGSRGRAG